jgi:hypothetical protein
VADTVPTLAGQLTAQADNPPTAAQKENGVEIAAGATRDTLDTNEEYLHLQLLGGMNWHLLLEVIRHLEARVRGRRVKIAREMEGRGAKILEALSRRGVMDRGQRNWMVGDRLRPWELGRDKANRE